MNREKIQSKFYLIPIILVFALIIIVYYSNYNHTVNIIKSQYESTTNLIEQSIQSEIKYTEIISKIIDQNIHDDMEENAKAIINQYKQNPKVLEWDLGKIKEQLGHMDIYILDQELKVIASSIEEEIGLDFSLYPSYFKLLKQRLAGNKFESDTINFSILNGDLKKYSYMPTPDNQYLIELSVTIKEIYPELEDLNIVYLSRLLKNQYEFVEDMRVYKYNKSQEYAYHLDSLNKQSIENKNLTKDRDLYIKKALETKEIQKHTVKDENHNFYTFKYIPYATYSSGNNLTWWQSYVVEIQYNDQLMINNISHQKRLFVQNLTLVSISYLALTLIVIYLIRKNHKIAHMDHLTKLANRKRFEEILEMKIISANKNNTKIAVLFFDIDNFKDINDSLGHYVGDGVLQEVANRIKLEIPKGDLVSRLGGDEFAGLISNVSLEQDIVEIGDRMAALFKEKFLIDSHEIHVTPSIGISIYPDHGETIKELLLKADSAMYEAKKKGMEYKIYK